MKNILPIIIIVAAIAGITIYSQSSSDTEPKTVTEMQAENHSDTTMET